MPAWAWTIVASGLGGFAFLVIQELAATKNELAALHGRLTRVETLLEARTPEGRPRYPQAWRPR